MTSGQFNGEHPGKTTSVAPGTPFRESGNRANPLSSADFTLYNRINGINTQRTPEKNSRKKRKTRERSQVKKRLC